MSRTNSVYKETYNRCLDFIKELGPRSNLPPETTLAEKWHISRTTVRSVLEHLDEAQIIHWEGRDKQVLRKPRKSDYFAVEETRSAGKRVETAFMEYVLGGDLAPGTILREAELVREFGISTSAVREFLIRFSRFGLIEKKPNRHWVLNGFTREFAIELFDVREMFELRAFNSFFDAWPSPEAQAQLAKLEQEHLEILDDMDANYLRFPNLDERFHRMFTNKLHNRFVDDFYELVAMIFHFHYRWRKTDERERNEVAAEEHLKVIQSILASDRTKAEDALKAHLQSARRTLLNSVVWE
ncbi:GntR family transcriptional regulator [Primorskyibacter sedentarius]|uniref:GntR family transcriptional regulator n=1 Tax=Primorskyibacter sedentarius TaxID=745311 RepID=A0A4R3J7X3_9RHOB|nr:GntR family transcriptional regulator [Primorskyibacter sedentarius]TCS61557.1 GntR family transcriptional regulator [Primorskyibacter sedentarius]